MKILAIGAIVVLASGYTIVHRATADDRVETTTLATMQDTTPRVCCAEDKSLEHFADHLSHFVLETLGNADVRGFVDYDQRGQQLQFDLSGSLFLDFDELADLVADMSGVVGELEHEISMEMDRLSVELDRLSEELQQSHGRASSRRR